MSVLVLPEFTYANATITSHGNVKKEWSCQSGANGGWVCNVFNRSLGSVFNATVITPASTKTIKSGNHDNDHSQQSPTLPSPATSLDWASIDKLPSDFLQNKQTLLCQGNYLEPDWPGKYFKGNADKASIKADAKKYNYQTQGNGELKGNVQIVQGNRFITSQVAHLDQNNNTATFIGDVVIRQPGMLIVAQNGTVNTKSNYVKVDHAEYVLQKQHLRGSARDAEKLPDGKIKLKEATYTSAPPNSNAWLFSADKMTLNPNKGWGSASNAVLHLAGFPVLYTPYASFPIDNRRKTGLLYPAFVFSDSNGFDYTQPLYFNIAPNFDDTLVPRHTSNRGFLLSNQFRYLQPGYSGALGATVLAQKDAHKTDNPYFNRSRWFYYWKHHQQLTKNWNVGVDYAKASDKNFLKDFGQNDWNDSGYGPLVRSLQSEYRGAQTSDHPWILSAQATEYQNMTLDSNDPYNRMPEITLAGNWQINPRLNTSYLVGYTDFNRANDWMFQGTEPVDASKNIYRYIYGSGTGINNAQGSRFHTKDNLSYRLEQTYGFWETGTEYRGVLYNLDNLNLAKNPTLTNHPSMGAFSFYTGGGLYFDRQLTFNKILYKQTLEPQIKYVYTPYVKNQDKNPDFDTAGDSFTYNSLWQIDRFNGFDRIGDTNHVALGITSRILDKQGIEKMRFGIGQIVYFNRRRVLLDPSLIQTDNINDSNAVQARNRLLDDYKSPVSPLASQFIWNIDKHWFLQQDFVYNTRNHFTDQYYFGLNWASQNGRLFNFGYRYLSQPDRLVYLSDGNATSPARYANGDLNAIEASFVVPVSFSWKAMGLWSYDIANSRNLIQMFGLQKDTCSYKIRLVYRSYIDPTQHVETAKLKHGLFLQFVLKGLGSVMGDNVDEYLKDINGYQPDNE